jgi:hypothetical protein
MVAQHIMSVELGRLEQQQLGTPLRPVLSLRARLPQHMHGYVSGLLGPLLASLRRSLPNLSEAEWRFLLSLIDLSDTALNSEIISIVALSIRSQSLLNALAIKAIAACVCRASVSGPALSSNDLQQLLVAINGVFKDNFSSIGSESSVSVMSALASVIDALAERAEQQPSAVRALVSQIQKKVR